MARTGLIVLAIALQGFACGEGADELVGIHVSDPSMGSGEWGGDEGAESDSGRATESGTDGVDSDPDPLEFLDPTGVSFCGPQPGEGMYSTCEVKSDCDPTDSCFTWGEEQTLCSRLCDTDVDCPGIPGCGAKPTCTRDVCTLDCAADRECPDGMSCTLFAALGVNICI